MHFTINRRGRRPGTLGEGSGRPDPALNHDRIAGLIIPPLAENRGINDADYGNGRGAKRDRGRGLVKAGDDLFAACAP